MGRFARTQHRTRAERQMRLASAAIAHGNQQRLEGGIASFGHSDFFLSAANGIGRRGAPPEHRTRTQLNSMGWPCRSNGMNEANKPVLMDSIMRCSDRSAS